MDRELRAMLDGSPYQVELYAEHLETTLFDDPAEQLEIRESRTSAEISKAVDQTSSSPWGPSTHCDSWSTRMKNFFHGIPVVFGGTSEQQADNPPLDFNFTGCWEIFEPTKTLDAALLLQPGTKHVVVVGGTSSFDKHLEALFGDSLHSYEARLDLTPYHH